MRPTIGVTPLLVVAKEEILPEPDAAKPMEVLEFVQLYEVPATLNDEPKFTAVVEEPTQIF